MAAEKHAEFLEELGQYKYGFKDPSTYVFRAQKGLNEEVVRNISYMKN